MSKYIPSVVYEDYRKHLKNYFYNFIRYEDNLSFSLSNVVRPPLPIDYSRVIKEVSMDIDVTTLNVHRFIINKDFIDYDRDEGAYCVELRHGIKEDIIMIQCDDSIRSLLFDYEVISKRSIRFKFINKMNTYVYIISATNMSEEEIAELLQTQKTGDDNL